MIHHLQGRGYQILEVLEQEPTGRLATVRLQPPGAGPQAVILGLLFASSGIEPEVIGRKLSAEPRCWKFSLICSYPWRPPATCWP